MFICLLLTIVGWSAGDVTDGTTLVFTFLVHRHGDRTPLEESAALCTDPAACIAASEPYGYGQLTDIGKCRSYALGQSIRRRYNSLLSPQYKSSEIYLRSTDSIRTQMTILTAMAAVYPAYPGSWSENINWVPVPYTTVPALYDFVQVSLNCPAFATESSAIMMSNPSRMAKYSKVLAVIAEVANKSAITQLPVLAYGYYDAYVSQASLGIPLDSRIEAIMDDLAAAAGEAVDILYGDEDSLSLLSGVLLNEFFIYAESTINGVDTPRVRIYSGHDMTVFPFTAVSQVTPRQGVPKYAANFALELRKVDGSNQYGVLAVYEPSPGEDLIYLPIQGCDTLLCPIDTFKSIVSKYILDEDTWRTKCEWTSDLVIDDSGAARILILEKNLYSFRRD